MVKALGITPTRTPSLQGSLLPFAVGLLPVWTAFPSSDYYGSSVTIGLAPRRPSRSSLMQHYKRDVGGPLMPSPPSLGGAGLSEIAQSLRLFWRRVHLALRRCSQRPSIDRWALDFRQFSFRRITRVSPSNGLSVFAPFPALSACSCSLTLSGSGKPLTQGSPLNPSHLRWGCCR